MLDFIYFYIIFGIKWHLQHIFLMFMTKSNFPVLFLTQIWIFLPFTDFWTSKYIAKFHCFTHVFTRIVQERMKIFRIVKKNPYICSLSLSIFKTLWLKIC